MRSMKWGGWYLGWAMLAGVVGFGVGEARGDFAPLKVGNAWVYRGSNVDEKWGTNFGYHAEQFQESLKLKVTGRRATSDTVFYTVSFSDSLFSRQIQVQGNLHDTVLNLNDTVLKETRTYFDLGGNAVYRLNGHRDEIWFGMTDPFFSAHDTLAYALKPVPQVKNGYSVFERLLNPSDYFATQGWYVVNVGMYWVRIQSPIDDCGFNKSIRNLILVSFNGKAIDLGVSPPIPPLTKQAQTEKITCETVRRQAGGMTVAAHRNGMVANVMGRMLGSAAKSF